MARHDDNDDDDDRPRSRGRYDDNNDDDDDRPRRRKAGRDDDDFEDRPRRKKSGGGGGGKVVLIVLGVVGALILICGVGGYLLLLPAITKVREAASRVNELNNLKQVSLGVINYTGTNNGRPPRADGDLSWRVHILPYIEQDNLYRQFDTNAAWNQGRNQQLAETFIKTYQSPLDDPPTSQTHYRVFTGEGSGFDTNLWKRPYPSYITDGTSNTLMLIDTAETVPWPAPKEVLLQKGGQFPDFGHPKRSQVLTGTWDGAVRAADKKALDAAKVRALATATGGETVGDW